MLAFSRLASRSRLSTRLFSSEAARDWYVAPPLVIRNGTVVNHDGMFKAGKREGVGTLATNDSFVYEGAWVDGQMHGIGHTKYANGDDYVGCFMNGKRDGLGTMTFANGEIYDGMWKDGEAFTTAE